MRLGKRLNALEAEAGRDDLPASVQRWLGWPVDSSGDAEDGVGIAGTETLSKEDKAWLGID